jgi:hypothetical protein
MVGAGAAHAVMSDPAVTGAGAHAAAPAHYPAPGRAGKASGLARDTFVGLTLDRQHRPMSETNLTSDRYFDLSLRLLTIFVTGSLICCLSFLAYNYFEPKLRRIAPAASSQQVPAVPAPAPAPAVMPEPADKLLYDPKKAFKCKDSGGHTKSFSDRPCESGIEEVLPLTSAPGAAAQGTAAPAAPTSPTPATAGPGPSDRGGR